MTSLLLTTLLLAAQPQAVPPVLTESREVDGAGAPRFVVPRVDGVDASIRIDGDLDEPAWSRAVRLIGFSEYRPVDRQRAAERTEVLVWYAADALYFGIIAYDSEPGSIRATSADRDSLEREDSVRIYLDTFHDRRRAFVFGVNPLGVQEDGVQTEGAFSAGRMMGGSIDLSPDYQFESRGRLTPFGYTVEVRIPFKSLRYLTTPGATWGINVLRRIQRTGREDTWTDAQRVASFLAQAGTMEGLADMERGVVTELQPFMTGAATGLRSPDGRFSREAMRLEPGANLRLGFTNMSVDATINPDFSQVESDAAQVTVNERFALFFSEKRPFFLEGIELFSTPNQLVYTRRIVAPIGGLKLTGKVGRTGLALLAARDEAGQQPAWATIARVRRDVGSDSLAGATFTDRSETHRFNRVVAADVRHVFRNLYYVLGQVGGSWTGFNGRTTSAPMFQAEFDRTARRWGFNYRLTGFGKGFEAASGFVPRQDIVELSAFNRLTHYGTRGALVESVSVFFGPTRIWAWNGFLSDPPIEGGESVNVSAALRGGWSVSARPARSFARLMVDRRPTALSVFSGTASVTTPVFAKVNGRVEVRTGGAIIFAAAAEGRETRVTTSLSLRPTRSTRIEGSVVRSRLTMAHDGSLFARSTIPRLRLEFQPRRAIFVRMITEYRSEQAAPFVPLSRALRTDWLVSFEPSPGTVVFVGYGLGHERDERRFGTDDLRRTSDGFFVKLAYLVRR